MPLQSNGNVLFTWSRSNPPQISLDPGSVWSIGTNPFLGYILKPEPAIVLPKKLYGSTERDTQLYLDRWATWDKQKQLAIFLSGKPGSGKTLQAKHTAVTSGLPIIFVNHDFANEGFVKFVNDAINTPVCMIFDEFEKVYAKKESQEFLLTVLDGVMAMKNVLMIMTSNTRDINTYMKNRPGRIHYMRDYSGLEPEFIIDYCKDRNVSLDMTKEILKLSNKHEEGFNFDSLQAIVAELQHEDYRTKKLGRPERAFNDIVSYMNVAGSSLGNHGYDGIIRGTLGTLFEDAIINTKSRDPFTTLALGDTFRISITNKEGQCFVPGVPHWKREHTITGNDVIVFDKVKQTFSLKIQLGTWWEVGSSLEYAGDTFGFYDIVNDNKARIRAKNAGEDFVSTYGADSDGKPLDPEKIKDWLSPDDFANPTTPSPWLLLASIKPSGMRKLNGLAKVEASKVITMVRRLVEAMPNLVEEFETAAMANRYTLPSLDVIVDFSVAESPLASRSYTSTFIHQGAY